MGRAGMASLDEHVNRTALARFLANAANAERVEIMRSELLSGGTVNENWLLEVDIKGGPEQATRALVLRADRATRVTGALARHAEFAVMRAAYAVGVTLPEPLWFADADGPLGREFFVMRQVEGTASLPAIVRDPKLGGSHAHLAERLGAELARLQTVTPRTVTLEGLPPASGSTAARRIAETRALLDAFDDAHPGIEWSLRWLELNAPPAMPAVLVHGDFRTGNYLVDAHGLTAILDWELAQWGDPHEDMGWFLMRFWRLDHPELEAGRIAPRSDFLRGYERAVGRSVDRHVLTYWEIMANVRWAAIALHQARRHLSGAEQSLELCLTGCRAAEPEFEALRLIGELTARVEIDDARQPRC